MVDLPKVVCRILGHDWDFPKCVRCGMVQIIHVYRNGLLMSPSLDYTQTDDGEVTLVETPAAGDTVVVAIGMQGGLWGRNDFVADGGTKTYKAHSY